MSNFSKFSKIEQFRRMRHGAASRLYLLGEDPNGEGYSILAQLTSRFYVTRGGIDTNIGEYRAKLVFDRPANVAASVLNDVLFADLVLADLVRRYRLTTETPPTTTEDRWHCQVTAAFNDNTPVVNGNYEVG